MEQKLYKAKVAKQRKETPNRRVDISMNIRIDEAVKARFVKSIRVGRPTTITDTIENLMNAYADAVEQSGVQPEFPIQVLSKVGGHGNSLAQIPEKEKRRRGMPQR